MDYTQTKKAFRQIENWRKEIAEKEQKHINNITDKNILLYLAKKQVKKLTIPFVSVTFVCPNGCDKGHIDLKDDYIECKECAYIEQTN